MKRSTRRLAPAIIAFFLTIVVLLPSALALPQHGDEKMYVWKAAYYGNRLSNLDFSAGSGSYLDPGWRAASYWNVEQPLGSHLIYYLTLRLANAPSAPKPYSYTDVTLQGSDTDIPTSTLFATRFAAILCAALGLALIVLRFGWPGLAAALVFLAIPFVRDDLARAWAEGPLMLGFGLCAISYGSRWFAPMCGLAAALKLTALGLWPLAFWHGWGRSRYAHILAIVSASMVWAIASPTSWTAGGPPYLVSHILHRVVQYADQSMVYGGAMGLFLPTRYLWPIVLLILLLLAHATTLYWRSRTRAAHQSATAIQ